MNSGKLGVGTGRALERNGEGCPRRREWKLGGGLGRAQEERQGGVILCSLIIHSFIHPYNKYIACSVWQTVGRLWTPR